MERLITTATSSDEEARAARTAVLPVGSFEQHSTFLPLTTDTLIACAIAKRISDDSSLFLLPPITVSCSHEHSAFAGTVSISAVTLAAVVTDIAGSLRQSNVDGLIVVNGHGGNYVLSNVVQQSNVDGRRMTLFPARPDWDTARSAANLNSTTTEDMHAGELEVSIMLATLPELVGDDYRTSDVHAPSRPHLLLTGMQDYTATGVIGHPSAATADKGRAILDSLAGSFIEHLRRLDPIR